MVVQRPVHWHVLTRQVPEPTRRYAVSDQRLEATSLFKRWLCFKEGALDDRVLPIEFSGVLTTQARVTQWEHCLEIPSVCVRKVSGRCDRIESSTHVCFTV